MSKKVCPSCGASYGDSSVFCRQCGKKLIEFEVGTNENNSVVFNEVNNDTQKPKIQQIKSSNTRTAVKTQPLTSYDGIRVPDKNSDKQQTQEFDLSDELPKIQQHYGGSSMDHIPTRDCPRCGAIIPADSRFCPACKEELSDNYFADDDYGQTRNLKTPIIIICSVIGVILLSVLIVRALSNNTAEEESSLQSSMMSSIIADSSIESSTEEIISSEPEEYSYEESEYSEESEYYWYWEESDDESSEDESSEESFEESSEDESSEQEESNLESSEEESFEESNFEFSEEESFEESDFESSDEFWWDESSEESSELEFSFESFDISINSFPF